MESLILCYLLLFLLLKPFFLTYNIIFPYSQAFCSPSGIIVLSFLFLRRPIYRAQFSSTYFLSSFSSKFVSAFKLCEGFYFLPVQIFIDKMNVQRIPRILCSSSFIRVNLFCFVCLFHYM